mmetsp:Transcript_21311/g.50700  ORF Transcript_21311/g.50700 Transcript_21311/m.50700 type:complete len:215 (-) Transcript_21311:58-702(-)
MMHTNAHNNVSMRVLVHYTILVEFDEFIRNGCSDAADLKAAFFWRILFSHLHSSIALGGATDQLCQSSESVHGKIVVWCQQFRILLSVRARLFRCRASARLPSPPRCASRRVSSSVVARRGASLLFRGGGGGGSPPSASFPFGTRHQIGGGAPVVVVLEVPAPRDGKGPEDLAASGGEASFQKLPAAGIIDEGPHEHVAHQPLVAAILEQRLHV